MKQMEYINTNIIERMVMIYFLIKIYKISNFQKLDITIITCKTSGS